MAKIAIDNGHGRLTAGKRTPPFPTTNKVIHEWQFNHATALKLKKILEAQGHQVLMVSDTENDTPLSTRALKANQWGADILVSIHYNAYQSIWGSHGGVEVLYRSEEGRKLAQIVQTELVKATGLRDRGIKLRTDLGILNSSKMVAILPECGFMDNLHEASLMLDEKYQERCASAISNGINKYLGIAPKASVVPPTPAPISVPTVVNPKDTPSTWASAAWNWAKQQGLLDGTRPKDPVTREELATILKRLVDRKLI